MSRRRRRLRRTLQASADRAEGGSRGWAWLAASALLFLLSLGAVARVSAMPAEARTQETWYAYQHELRYDFSARVIPGSIYPRDLVGAQELVQTRQPSDPPTYRRVLVGPLTETLRISLPYRFTADREALLRASYVVDGELRVPNLWRRPYRLLDTRTITARTAELRLDDLAVEIPVQEILGEVKRLSEEYRLPADQVEVRIRPILTVEVEGQREPVRAEMKPEFLVIMRNGGVAIELDEPRTVNEEQRFQRDERVPLTVDLWGYHVRVAVLRQAAYIALGLFALLLLAGVVARWAQRRREPADELRRLGHGLIQADGLSLPDGASMVEVRNLEQLVQLHLQSERPVVQVDQTYYLIDGSTCYRCSLADRE